jgi:glycosyltransferase involved in cell wall biosynthesis
VPDSLIYEANLDLSSHGGGPLHFRGLASALEGELGDRFTAVLPLYRAERPWADERPSARWRLLPVGRKSAAAALRFELRKARLLLRARRGGRRGVLLHRLYLLDLAGTMARLLGFTVVIEVNGLYRHELQARGWPRWARTLAELSTRLQMRSAHSGIAVTDGLAQQVRATYGLECAVVPNGTAVRSSDRPQPSPATGRRLVYVGALAPWQDLGFVFRGLSELNRAAAADDDDERWMLEVIGDGEERAKLEALAVELGVEDVITWHGWVHHDLVAAHLDAGGIGIVPLIPKAGSETCGSPLKLFEYLAHGLPVVASDIDGVRELDLPRLHRYDPSDLGSFVHAVVGAAAERSLDRTAFDQLRAAVSWEARSHLVLEHIDLTVRTRGR